MRQRWKWKDVPMDVKMGYLAIKSNTYLKTDELRNTWADAFVHWSMISLDAGLRDTQRAFAKVKVDWVKSCIERAKNGRNGIYDVLQQEGMEGSFFGPLIDVWNFYQEME